jgi:hypothetical protein
MCFEPFQAIRVRISRDRHRLQTPLGKPSSVGLAGRFFSRAQLNSAWPGYDGMRLGKRSTDGIVSGADKYSDVLLHLRLRNVKRRHAVTYGEPPQNATVLRQPVSASSPCAKSSSFRCEQQMVITDFGIRPRARAVRYALIGRSGRCWSTEQPDLRASAGDRWGVATRPDRRSCVRSCDPIPQSVMPSMFTGRSTAEAVDRLDAAERDRPARPAPYRPGAIRLPGPPCSAGCAPGAPSARCGQSRS